MKLLFVIDNLGSGGAQRQMTNLALGLQGRGHSVEFFVYYPQDIFGDSLREAGIPIHRERKSWRFDPRIILALRRKLKAGDYDLVLSFLDTPNFYSELACGLRRPPRLVASERFCDPPEGMSRRHYTLRQFHRLADFVTTNSHHQREMLTQTFPWLRPKIATIYNGVDLNRFSPGPIPRASSAPLQLLVVASVSPYKNGLRLIEALDILRERHGLRPVVRWVGEHQMHLAERRRYSEAMQAQIERRKLASQWEWLHQRKDIPELMRAHDALIHPSYSEGLPNVVCEALASGLPVVASNLLDHPRLIQDGVTGFLFQWNDPASLAERIKQLHALSPEQRARLRAAARTFAESNLSLSRFVAEYELLFERLVGSRVATGRFSDWPAPSAAMHSRL